jgi:PAS domain S-box-containing protein
MKAAAVRRSSSAGRPMEIRVRPHAITAVTFPADDAVFSERVRELLEGPLVSIVDNEDLVDELVERLRLVYPGVATRFRDPLAGFGDRPLYVFRDGTATSSLVGEDWIRDPATARVVTDRGGRYLEADDAAERLFGATREEIIGNTAGGFTRPDARIQDADALWRALATTGKLHSLALVRCRDGRERSVEFLTIRDGDGSGRNVTYLRAIH